MSAHPSWCQRPDLPASHTHRLEVGSVPAGVDEHVIALHLVQGPRDAVPLLSLDVGTPAGWVKTRVDLAHGTWAFDVFGEGLRQLAALTSPPAASAGE